jgi:hypothetical protein
MLSIVLDLPDNLDVLTKCLSMVAAYRQDGGTEVVVPWEGRPRDILPILKAFSSRIFWKLILCPLGKGGSLAAMPYASGDNPIVMSHRILVDSETLKSLFASPGRASVYRAENFPLQWDPYSFWLPVGYREACFSYPVQTQHVVTEEYPMCASGQSWSDTSVLLLPGTDFRLGENLSQNEAIVISSTDKPSFPPDEDRL